MNNIFINRVILNYLMVNYNAVNYIRNGLKRGIPISTLKNNLANQGWNFEDISEAVKEASRNKTKGLNPLIFILIFGLVLIIVLFLIFGSPDPDLNNIEEPEDYSGNVFGCYETWDCGSWSTCSGGVKTRVCVDLNDCGTEEIKHPTIRDCYFGWGDNSSTNDDEEDEDEPYCGDGICNGDETNETCIEDCPNVVEPPSGLTNDEEYFINFCQGEGGFYCGEGFVCSGVTEIYSFGNIDFECCLGGACKEIGSLCGNGVLNKWEECDDGNLVGGDGCNSFCELEYCGDFIINNVDENCEDGNNDSGDGCSSSCKIESGWGCHGDPSNCYSICGDNSIVGNEECDDGNLGNGDGCSSFCEIEFCSDGLIVGNEECDDGNLANGDGCQPDCIIQSGWECFGEPSDCHPIGCGDGSISVIEACDDGNLANGDGCNSICEMEMGWGCQGQPSDCHPLV
jgi:cysteine-rich repeat protein